MGSVLCAPMQLLVLKLMLRYLCPLLCPYRKLNSLLSKNTRWELSIKILLQFI